MKKRTKIKNFYQKKTFINKKKVFSYTKAVRKVNNESER